LDKLRRLKAETLVFTDAGHRPALRAADRVIAVPASLRRRGATPEDLYTPIPYIIPGQLFAACLAAQKGIDPDRPRTLSKVTRTL